MKLCNEIIGSEFDCAVSELIGAADRAQSTKEDVRIAVSMLREVLENSTLTDRDETALAIIEQCANDVEDALDIICGEKMALRRISLRLHGRW